MSLYRNTFYNLLGQGLPVLISLVTVPLYLRHVGAERYGVIAMVWLLLGYFGAFDFGLSRATNNLIAKLHDAPALARQEVFWTTFWLNLAFGVTGGAILWLTSSFLMIHVFSMQDQLRQEVLAVMPWVAATVPLGTLTYVLTGAVEGRERFAVANILSLLSMMSFQILPLLAAIHQGPQLTVVIPTSIMTRIAYAICLMISLIWVLPLNRVLLPKRSLIREVLGYGAWISVTGLLAPLMGSLDRMLIGSTLGARFVAYYSVPFNVIDKLRILPSAINRTLFPHFSKLSMDDARGVAVRGILLSNMAMTFMVVPGIFLVAPFLRLWLGVDFAAHAVPVARTILVGVWFTPGYVCYAFLQAKGRPDLLAKLQAIELVPFAGLLWVSLHFFGLEGGAWAWATRAIVDSLLLCKLADMPWSQMARLLPPMAVVAMAHMVSHFLPETWLVSIAAALLFSLITLAWVWVGEPDILRDTAGRLPVIGRWLTPGKT